MKQRFVYCIIFIMVVGVKFVPHAVAEAETNCLDQLAQNLSDVFETEKIFLTPDEQIHVTETVSQLCDEQIEDEEFAKQVRKFIISKSHMSVEPEEFQKGKRTLTTSPLALLLLMEVLSVGVKQNDNETAK